MMNRCFDDWEPEDLWGSVRGLGKQVDDAAKELGQLGELKNAYGEILDRLPEKKKKYENPFDDIGNPVLYLNKTLWTESFFLTLDKAVLHAAGTKSKLFIFHNPFSILSAIVKRDLELRKDVEFAGFEAGLDYVVFDQGPHRQRIRLAVESEWSANPEDAAKDFEKILGTEADLKLLLLAKKQERERENGKIHGITQVKEIEKVWDKHREDNKCVLVAWYNTYKPESFGRDAECLVLVRERGEEKHRRLNGCGLFIEQFIPGERF